MPCIERSRLLLSIVPWGNFQTYMIRPDADEGPFVSRHKNRPSEKAWRKFMEGSTVSMLGSFYHVKFVNYISLLIL